MKPKIRNFSHLLKWSGCDVTLSRVYHERCLGGSGGGGSGRGNSIDTGGDVCRTFQELVSHVGPRVSFQISHPWPCSP